MTSLAAVVCICCGLGTANAVAWGKRRKRGITKKLQDENIDAYFSFALALNSRPTKQKRAKSSLWGLRSFCGTGGKSVRDRRHSPGGTPGANTWGQTRRKWGTQNRNRGTRIWFGDTNSHLAHDAAAVSCRLCRITSRCHGRPQKPVWSCTTRLFHWIKPS